VVVGTARGAGFGTVVGAGSAGCVVAARLTDDPVHRVLLLEASPDRRVAEHMVASGRL